MCRHHSPGARGIAEAFSATGFPPQHLNRGKEAGEIQMYSSAGLQAFLAMLALDLLCPRRKIKFFKQKILKKILVPSFFILASHEVHRKDLHVTGKAFACYCILSFLVSQKPKNLEKAESLTDYIHCFLSCFRLSCKYFVTVLLKYIRRDKS